MGCHFGGGANYRLISALHDQVEPDKMYFESKLFIWGWMGTASTIWMLDELEELCSMNLLCFHFDHFQFDEIFSMHALKRDALCVLGDSYQTC